MEERQGPSRLCERELNSLRTLVWDRWREAERLARHGILVVVLQCGKKKNPGSRRAIELYCGTYFSLSRELARKLVDDGKVFILSAKHRVLPSDRLVEPYDQSLRGLPSDGLREWRKEVSQFVSMELVGRGLTPLFVCGQLYSVGLSGIKLLPSVGIGYQMMLMKELLKGEGFGLCFT